MKTGNAPIHRVKQRFNEEAHNENGERLTEFFLINRLRINIYFEHRIQQKITW